MSHDSPTSASHQPSWRFIVGPAMLLPSLLILAWSMPLWNRSADEPRLPAGSADDRQRLNRLLHQPSGEQRAALQGDVVRVASDKQAQEDADRSEQNRLDDAELDLSAIDDNHFGIPAAERSAYEQCLAAARAARLTEWEQAARSDATFAALMLDTPRWRGKLVEIDGELRRLNRLTSPAAAGETTATDVWEAWLLSSDSGRNPFRVIVVNEPTGIPLGDSVQPARRVRVTGLFFKRYSYSTANGFHTAPLLIAPVLTALSPSHPAIAAKSPRSVWLTVVAVGGLLLFFAAIGIGHWSARRANRSVRTAVRELRDAPAPDFHFLDDSQPR